MSSSSNPLPSHAPYATRRHTIIDKLSSVVDMLERALSVENMIGDDQVNKTVEEHLKEIEISTFSYLRRCYHRLGHFIQEHAFQYEDAILHKMSIDPIFLAPTTVTRNPHFEESIVPMMALCQDYTIQSAFIPAALELCLEHHFYPNSEYGGLLTGFSRYVRPSRMTNVLIEVINSDNTHLANRLFSTFLINGSTLQASNALDHFYHPGNRKAFDVIRQRDNSILCRPIGDVHPIHNLLRKLNRLDGAITKPDFRKWLGFIYHYIHVAAHQYPSESGFMFLLYNNRLPIFLAFLKKENIFFNNSLCGIRAIYRIFNSLDNPTGLLHKVLLHCSPYFMMFVKHVHNKGEYLDFSSSPQSLLQCFIERKRFHLEEARNDELEILYWIFRNWPGSIEETQMNRN